MKTKSEAVAEIPEVEERIKKEDCMSTGGECSCSSLASCERLGRNCEKHANAAAAFKL